MVLLFTRFNFMAAVQRRIAKQRHYLFKMMKENILVAYRSSIEAKTSLLNDPKLLYVTEQVIEAMVQCFQSGKRVYFCGNGGSAADAQHLAAELSGSFYNRNRPALPAEALHTNTSYLTAVANDFSYDHIYARLVQGMMQPGDMLIGMSTSGNSANIVQAFTTAKAKGVITVGMTGNKENAMQALSDYYLPMPSADTPRIQECHMLVGHTICQLVEAKLFGA